MKTVDAGKEIGATDSIRPSSTKRVDESATKPVLVPRNDVEDVVVSEENDDPSERRSLRNPEKRPTTVATRDMRLEECRQSSGVQNFSLCVSKTLNVRIRERRVFPLKGLDKPHSLSAPEELREDADSLVSTARVVLLVVVFLVRRSREG